MAGKQPKYYVVWKGHQPGIYFTWEDCKKQVEGFKDAVYKAFSSLEEANDAFKHPATYKSELTLDAKNKPVYGICVDGAYSSSTKAMEYRGVLLPENIELFRQGPFYDATNNTGEFLAVVHALALCKQKNWDFPIYSDSKTAISWIKRKKANTKLEATERNTYLFELIRRAEIWLTENKYTTQLLKWDTVSWDENPADFGRK